MHPQPHMATPVIRKPETAVYRCDGSCLLHNLSPRVRTKKKQVLEMAVLQSKLSISKNNPHIWSKLTAFGCVNSYITFFFSDMSLESRPRYDS